MNTDEEHTVTAARAPRTTRRLGRHLLTGFATLAASIGLSAAPAGGVAGFGDVEEDLFFTEAVQWMVDAGVTSGVTPACFAPDEHVTRGELAVFLHRLEEEPGGSPSHAFTDVAPWQSDAVSWMVDEGITTGTSSTTYSPARGLSRGEFAVFLHRLAGSPDAPRHEFDDVAARWQQGAIAWLVDAGVTTGTSATTYSPDAPVTRGQLAAFLHRFRGQPRVTVDGSTPFCERSRTPRQVTATEWATFATTGPVTLVHPATRVELIGFHESNHDGARQMDAAPSAATSVTMDSRSRGNESRTAADIVVPPTAEIRAPVTGIVIRSGGYVLYCDIADEFVVIEPADRPGWEVKVLHIDGVTVRPGDRVVVGSTLVARRATQLPFVSQVDEQSAEPSWPHVHIEVIDPSISDRPGRGC